MSDPVPREKSEEAGTIFNRINKIKMILKAEEFPLNQSSESY
jgi:hypothetical protein